MRAKKVKWYKQQELKRTDREVILAQLEEMMNTESERKDTIMSTQSDETPDIGHHLISKVRDQFGLEEK